MEAMDKLDLATAVQDMRAALAFLRALPEVGQIGAVGLCLGGSLLLPLSSECGDELAAGASFYGHCNDHWLEEVDADIKAPLLFFYGDQDAVFPPEDVNALDAKVRALGKNYQIKR